eukprot:12048395-Ditylum_brightwellii.AAC.2
MDWDQLYNSYFTTKWENIQMRYWYTTKLKDPPKETHWLRRAISILWENTRTQWSTRNAVIHPSEKVWKDATTRDNLLHHIAHQHTYREQMLQGN